MDFSAPIRLEGFALPKNKITRGDPLVVLSYWRALGKIGEDYTVFLHLVNERGEIIAQQDAPPRNGNVPTSSWEPNQLVVDARVIPIPTEVSGKNLRLELGWYSPVTLERLRVMDARGAEASSVIIQPVTILE